MEKKKKSEPKKETPELVLPKKYKHEDVLNIIGLAKKGKMGKDIADLYRVSLFSLKKHVTVFRKLGYSVPPLRYTGKVDEKGDVEKKQKQDPKKLVTRKVDESKMKWVRVDNRTVIHVEKNIEDQEAIDQYYEKREKINQWFSRKTRG